MENLRFWNPLFWDTLPYPPKSKRKFFPKCMKSHRKISSLFADTRLLSAVPLKQTISTCLITVVSWGNHAKCISSYSFYLRRTKAGRERGTLSFQELVVLSWPACFSTMVQVREMLFIGSPSSQSGGRRKGERGDRRQEDTTDKNKALAKSGSP